MESTNRFLFFFELLKVDLDAIVGHGDDICRVFLVLIDCHGITKVLGRN
jgi:hypothetical protein